MFETFTLTAGSFRQCLAAKLAKMRFLHCFVGPIPGTEDNRRISNLRFQYSESGQSQETGCRLPQNTSNTSSKQSSPSTASRIQSSIQNSMQNMIPSVLPPFSYFKVAHPTAAVTTALYMFSFAKPCKRSYCQLRIKQSSPLSPRIPRRLILAYVH